MERRHLTRGANTLLLRIVVALVIVAGVMVAASEGQSVDLASQSPQPASTSTPAQGPLTLTLQDAIQRARANSPRFQSVLTDLGLAREDRVQARAALLPSVSETTQYLYTQGRGGSSPPDAVPVRFVANNAVHEYISQANAHEALSLTGIADLRRSGAALAFARAKAEVAARGLVVTVVQAYYGLVVAQRKYATAQQAATEAQRFFDISQKLEQGGEVAHSDVIKAEIQLQQQQRDLREAQLEMQKSRLELSVLLFPDFNQGFSVIDDLRLPAPLPGFAEIEAQGTHNNPDVRAALAALHEADEDVKSAWAGYLPSLDLDYWYGIDAPQFAIRDPQGFRNAGYSASATLVLPIWNWGATHSKVHQADLRRQQADREFTFAQRELLANLQSFYGEAVTSGGELELLAHAADLASDSLRLITLRYEAGESSVLEVVDAQNTLTQARNAYDDGQSRYRVALATLQTVTGSF